MRVLILTPTARPAVTGNAITVERWRRFLEAKGVRVRVSPTQGLRASSLRSEIESFPPDVIHVHHAFRAGSLLLDPRISSICMKTPMVVSPAGTDIHMDLQSKDRREIVEEVCARASAIVVQSQETHRRMRELLPRLDGKIVPVPKAFAWLGEQPFDLRGASGWGPGQFVFFLPAGIRPVKGNLECLMALQRVHAVRPQIRVVFAGPALDAEYEARFRREVERMRAFACWIPPIPPEAMRAAYEAADVVLNASFAEGLSNVLLEATAAGRPVLASWIPGNRWPVLGGNGGPPSGCLFDPHDPNDFVHKALRLIDDPTLRRSLGEAGRVRAAQWPGPEAEIDALIRVYEPLAALQ
jgi:glycosyltransferase involved in cell wall biosynthesis